MKRQILITMAATMTLSACSAYTSSVRTAGTEPEEPTIPDAVALLAAPGQNVQTARILPSDGCYWYEYAGIVETTLLPLKTADGRKICTGASGTA